MVKLNKEFHSQRQRKLENGKVVSSNRAIWVLSENDIINVAREKGIMLTEVELNKVSKYIDKYFLPNGEWYEAIDEGLSSIGIQLNEEEPLS